MKKTIHSVKKQNGIYYASIQQLANQDQYNTVRKKYLLIIGIFLSESFSDKFLSCMIPERVKLMFWQSQLSWDSFNQTYFYMIFFVLNNYFKILKIFWTFIFVAFLLSMKSIKLFKEMNKQQILCFPIPIKSQKQINEYKKREETYISNTPKILLGKLLQDTQQVWIQEYKCQKVSSLRQFHSNDHAFEIASQIVAATKQLSRVYGNFMLNQNMVFLTKSKKTFIWINSDIFVNTPKIFLPQTKEGVISMIKGLVNYFKLWLQTKYSALTEIQTLQELRFKLQQLKRQNLPRLPRLSKDLSLADLSVGSSNDSNEKIKLYQSSKGILLKKFSHEQYSRQHSKNSRSSSSREKCFTNRCFTSIPQGLAKRTGNQYGQASQASNVQSGSQGQKGSFSNSFSKQVSNSFRNVNKKEDQPKFPNKTTSSTLHILQKIKQQDIYPQEYTINKILIEDSQKQSEQQSKGKLKGSLLGGINEEIDNLFLSNIESEENENDEAVNQREKEFQEILDL